MTCIGEEEEEHVMLRHAIELSLKKNDDMQLTKRNLDNINNNNNIDNNIESTPFRMSQSTTTTFSEIPTTTPSFFPDPSMPAFYPDIDLNKQFKESKFKEWIRQEINKERRHRHFGTSNEILEDLSSYLYFLIKAACFSIVLMILGFFIISFIQLIFAFRSDINKEIGIISSDLNNLIQSCTKNYVINECGSDNRIPLLEENCTEWENCMNLDPNNSISTIEVIVKFLGRLISSFVGQLSHKTMLFLFITSLVIFGSTLRRFT
ncbi:hypothetical protein Glove_326g155 [Diversispora epigaea]|uniref:Brl1/Brr6 domain-containing protein n=1 Tax=Diversispora epigaea TaxID=1348612 RepID=A0A397HM76_9GLOM|nr:hypothetical protein Glove_326g155 [Diversispora epigaea]